MKSLVALYARVSSEKQAQSNTIDSQIVALRERIKLDEFVCPNELEFIDDGYSGTTLIRPALEKLRDIAAAGSIRKIYVHSPDRLARRYAYQALLIDEFQKENVEVIFLNRSLDETPESTLLFQMQGMIAEYERAKIMERNRRGKIHAAKRGSVNVLGTAPYGYRYINKHKTGGESLWEIDENEAITIRQIFIWVGKDKLSIGEVCRRLNETGENTRKRTTKWGRSTIWCILKNPAYKGFAAFGKTCTGPMRLRVRPQKRSCDQPRRAYSVYSVARENWISIPVPALISEELFEVVQEQLDENRKLMRKRERGIKYLLQGLLVCGCCKYAYYGKPVKNKREGKNDNYAYYRCTGTDAYRFGGEKICLNKQIRTNTIEIAVWEEIKNLIENPLRLEIEYKRRLAQLENIDFKKERLFLENQKERLQKGISRLIDSYAEGFIERGEFEPRVKNMKAKLETVETRNTILLKKQILQEDLYLMVERLQDFSNRVKSGLKNITWAAKREIIRILVKRIEIKEDEIEVILKLKDLSASINSKGGLQHCSRSTKTLFM